MALGDVSLEASLGVSERWRSIVRAPLPWLGLAVVAYGVIPAIGNDYWFSAILIPFLVLGLAGLGLNLLTGYAGQLSLGSSAFMAVGAFGPYKALVRIPAFPLPLGLASAESLRRWSASSSACRVCGSRASI